MRIQALRSGKKTRYRMLVDAAADALIREGDSMTLRVTNPKTGEAFRVTLTSDEQRQLRANSSKPRPGYDPGGYYAGSGNPHG